MSSLYEMFLGFRNVFTGEKSQNNQINYGNDSLLQGIQQMAANLSSFMEEINRIMKVQEQAIARIGGLVDDVKNITQQLAEKTLESEKSVDISVINELVEKLKTSTDGLARAVSTETELAERTAIEQAKGQ